MAASQAVACQTNRLGPTQALAVTDIACCVGFSLRSDPIAPIQILVRLLNKEREQQTLRRLSLSDRVTHEATE